MSMVHEYENGPLPGLKLPLQSPVAEAVTALLATKVFVMERVMNVQELADPDLDLFKATIIMVTYISHFKVALGRYEKTKDSTDFSLWRSSSSL